MPLPSATQLLRMQTQANSHGASSFTLLSKNETNAALGASVAYNEVSTFTGLKSSRPVRQEIQPGVFVTIMEQHLTVPADLPVTLANALLEGGTNDYYEVVNINKVDDNLLILQDLTIRRIKVKV